MPIVTSHEPGTPSWVDVASADIDASVAFYAGLFGWQASEAGDPEETGGYRMFSQGGNTVAGIGPVQTQGQPTAWMTYITVEDADATARKAKSVGGTVMMEPMDVMTAGRMAVLADPEGAAFAIWQPGESIGATLVNEPNSLVWNELRSRDTEGVKKFYGDVFGWQATESEQMPDYTIWTLGDSGPEHGKGGMMDMTVAGIPEEVPAHWDVAFAVADADQIAARCLELGGSVTVPLMDTGVGRMAGLRDPAGAAFTVIRLNTPA